MPGLVGGLGVAVVVVAISARGYVADSNATGVVRRWALEVPDNRVKPSSVNAATRAIIYRLDPAGYSAAGAVAELQSIRAAFDQWQAISGARVKFEEGPGIPGVTDVNSQDHTNSVFWARSLTLNGGRDNLRGILALTYVASFRDGNVIFDADTVFNGVEYGWSANPEEPMGQKAFVEAIALHEAGHFLGLQHSPVGGATMLVAGDFGMNVQLGLSADELAAARGMYPSSDGAGRVGRVTGRVSAAGQPVFGAAVFAENTLGELVSGTVSAADGNYSLGGLPTGTIVVRTAPLDPATALNYLVRGVDISTAYSGAQTTYAPSADRSAVVTGGGTTRNVDFEVVGGVPPRIVRLMQPADDLAAPAFTPYPIGVKPDGRRRYLGVLTSAKAGPDLRLEVTGGGFELGTAEILTNVVPGLTLVAMPATLATNAPPGLRSLRLRNGTQTGWAHGFLEILPPFPDANGDGLDDGFQRKYWTRFTAPEAGPAADPDQDGFSNTWEFQTGSIPTNAASAHFEVLSVRVTGAGSVVRSQAAKGKRFQLLGRDAWDGAAWESVGAPVTAPGDTVEFQDLSATRVVRFYRVEKVP